MEGEREGKEGEGKVGEKLVAKSCKRHYLVGFIHLQEIN